MRKKHDYFVFLDRPAWPSKVKCRVGAVDTEARIKTTDLDWRDFLPPTLVSGGRHVAARNKTEAIRLSGLKCPPGQRRP